MNGDPTPAAPTPIPATYTPRLPDLAIEQVEVQAIEPPDGDCTPPANSLRSAVTVANRGSAVAGEFTVQVDGYEQPVGSGLSPGETLTLIFPFTTTRPQIHIDTFGQVAESREADNLFTATLTQPELPAICRQTPTPVPVRRRSSMVFEGHTDPVLAAAFSPNGNLIASGSVDNSVRLWTVEQNSALRIMQGHSFPILCLEFTPAGSQLVTGSMDGKIRVWEVANSNLQRTLRGHAGWVQTIDISPDGQWLASGSDDFTVRIWRMANYNLAQTIDEGMTAIQSVAFSPDSKTLAWGEEDGTVRVRTLSGEWLHTLKGTALAAASLAFFPRGDELVSGYADGAIRIWGMNDGVLRQIFKTGSQRVTALAISPDGRWLVSAFEDGTLALWDLASAGPISAPAAIFYGHTGRVNDIDFSPTGSRFVSASEDGTLRLWEVPQ